MARTVFLLLPALASCASYRSARTDGNIPLASQEIRYASSDARDSVIFSREGTRDGPIVNLRPPSATRYLEPGEGVQCISIGVAGNTDEYAIKRPIRAGDRYQCLTSSFRVIRCFEGCRAAIVQVERLLINGQPYRSTMLINGCLGILAFSDTEDMAEGIPFEAMVLRGNVGILADPNYPNCRSF